MIKVLCIRCDIYLLVVDEGALGSVLVWFCFELCEYLLVVDMMLDVLFCLHVGIRIWGLQ